MKKSEQIIKSLVLPILEKDTNFKQSIVNSDFWNTLTSELTVYENDAKPIFKTIYELQLNDPEKVLSKLPVIHTNFIKELAEYFVLEGKDETIDVLLANKNMQFEEQVKYFKTVKNVVTKLERERIKKELSNNEELSFEIPEKQFEVAAKKLERENLKKKFKQWDEELEEKNQPIIFYSIEKQPNEKKIKPKVITLTWLKYAAAACLVLVGGILIYQNNATDIIQNDNNVVTGKPTDTTDTNQKTQIIQEPIKALVYSSNEIETEIYYPTELGYTNTNKEKKITIVFKDASQSVKELENLLLEINKKNIGTSSQTEIIKEQLETAKKQLGKYEFNGKELIIYSKPTQDNIKILSEDDKTFYFAKNKSFYKLYFTKLPQAFAEVNDPNIIENLEKISFENE